MYFNHMGYNENKFWRLIMSDPYKVAQHAMSDLKSAVYDVLSKHPDKGFKNSEIGRALGIYMGYIGHEGHISRTISAIMQQEGVAEQEEVTKLWRIRKNF
jgi:hypothetical protein